MKSPHRGFDPPIIGSSPAASRLRDLVLTLAGSDVSVLITGESGVGKEVLARNLHRFSGRSHRAFVSLNCAALPGGTLESELFGHARGSFTGAVRDHAGIFEQADGGTLFLDEIGEIPAQMQAKLLRVLQEREVRRMGDGRVRGVDVRLLSATNAELAGMVARGEFRKDLYYRINVVEARIPPLRERPGDVHDLLSHFFDRRNLSRPDVSPDARSLLERYPWPGNVRELENELERMIALCGPPGTIVPDLFSDRLIEGIVGAPPDAAVLCEAPLADAVGRLEERMLRRTLLQTNWNKSKTARRLGLSRQGLLKKIKRYGISREAPARPAED